MILLLCAEVWAARPGQLNNGGSTTTTVPQPITFRHLLPKSLQTPRRHRLLRHLSRLLPNLHHHHRLTPVPSPPNPPNPHSPHCGLHMAARALHSIPLHGKLRVADNFEDEWFTVFLLFHISSTFPDLSIRVWDSDGEFLLIEAAYHLPRWLNPQNSLNRVFIRHGHLHIVPKARLPNPTLTDSLNFIANFGQESLAAELVQIAVKNRISEYPARARRNLYAGKVRVPVAVAQVLSQEPCLIALAVEDFYDRDIDTMKYAGKMQRFLSRGREEELVCVSVKMSRAMYAQLVQQAFQAPKCYPMPNRSEDRAAYMEAELGMKIACGMEMMYQQRRKEGLEGKGSSWEAFKESLERSGYFEGLLPGSKEYQRLMQNAEEYYRNSAYFSRAR